MVFEQMTLLQKRTAETPSAQRVKKRTMIDVRRSIRVRDSLWNHPCERCVAAVTSPLCSGLINNPVEPAQAGFALLSRGLMVFE